jgi:ribosome modulation factor
MDEVFYEGYDAFELGQSVCPYDCETIDSIVWIAGWQRAKYDHDDEQLFEEFLKIMHQRIFSLRMYHHQIGLLGLDGKLE